MAFLILNKLVRAPDLPGTNFNIFSYDAVLDQDSKLSSFLQLCKLFFCIYETPKFKKYPKFIFLRCISCVIFQ